ncbi:hypothetical protein K2173_019572 [Erythroxylum novogranatense]|uniref:Tify domain-containing protein n=1 Tax=Erythroxylum novogranatense TaxID=1862640 RepID=A0AAV8UBM7_9ROSI|nr:hypothetical protein K2173_019572 [Erythroxylum novogranatense]
MYFQNQSYWVAKDNAYGNDNEINGDSSSRSELKRSHQWFMDGADVEALPNKKQSVGFPTANSFTGLLNSNVPSWGNTSSFQSILSPLTERLFDSEPVRAVNFDDRNILSVSSEKVSMGRKVDGDLFANDFPFRLSMSHTLEDSRPGLNFGGIREVKVSQDKESEHLLPISMEHVYNRVDNLPITLSTGHAFNRSDESTVSMGLAYNKEVGNIVSIGDTYERDNHIFISMGQTYTKSDEAISLTEAYKENNNDIVMNQTFSKGDDSIIYVGQAGKTDENSISMGQIHHKDNTSTISTSEAYSKENSSNLSVGQSYNKGESTIISFSGDNDNTYPSGMSSYELLMAQSSLQGSELMSEKQLVKRSDDALVSSSRITASGLENVSKKKKDSRTSKKIPPNNFPSNVRSLLSTGMLDGVHVKYIAWSREKELRGCIQGCGYLCGCQTCNYSKVINAYEFERHANCKTKHPNNHIYFENGKTIYGIVQELRSTPQNMLFEVIQTITGSPINQKAYLLWKESFLAATRELQRIYGKDEGTLLS